MFIINITSILFYYQKVSVTIICQMQICYTASRLITVTHIAVATIEEDEAIASSDFLKITGISAQNEPTRVILVSFDHFASSDFNVW